MASLPQHTLLDIWSESHISKLRCVSIYARSNEHGTWEGALQAKRTRTNLLSPGSPYADILPHHTYSSQGIPVHLNSVTDSPAKAT